MQIRLSEILDSGDTALFDVRSKAAGPSGILPVTPEMLRERPSGDLFGWTQNAGMGWEPAAMGGREFLILSTHGGIRAADGTPVALGYHSGHWEVGPPDGGRGARTQVAGCGPVRGRIAPTPATAARRAPRECSIPCPTATTRPASSAA